MLPPRKREIAGKPQTLKGQQRTLKRRHRPLKKKGSAAAKKGRPGELKTKSLAEYRYSCQHRRRLNDVEQKGINRIQGGDGLNSHALRPKLMIVHAVVNEPETLERSIRSQVDKFECVLLTE